MAKALTKTDAPSGASVAGKPAKSNRALVALLQEWQKEDAASPVDGREEWARLKGAIEANRLSSRRRFGP